MSGMFGNSANDLLMMGLSGLANRENPAQGFLQGAQFRQQLQGGNQALANAQQRNQLIALQMQQLAAKRKREEEQRAALERVTTAYGQQMPVSGVQSPYRPGGEPGGFMDAMQAAPGLQTEFLKRQFLPELPEQTDMMRNVAAMGQPQGTPAFQQRMGQKLFPPVAPKDTSGTSTALRKEFIAGSKDFVKVRDAHNRIKSITATPAGDMALIFNYMKMLDPASVVRESEFRTAAQAKAWLGNADQTGTIVPNNVRLAIQKAVEGTMLLPEQREDFISQAENLYGSQLTSHENLRDEYTALSGRVGVSPRKVVIDYRGKGRKGRKSGTAVKPSEMTDEQIQKALGL